MQSTKEIRLKEYTDFLEERVDSLEQEVLDLQNILTMIFESEEETVTNISIRFCTCDLDRENGDEDDEEDDEDDDWF